MIRLDVIKSLAQSLKRRGRTVGPNGLELKDGKIVLVPLKGFITAAAGRHTVGIWLNFEPLKEARGLDVLQVGLNLDGAAQLRDGLTAAIDRARSDGLDARQ